MSEQDDWLIFDFSVIHGASKSLDYRNGVVRQCTAVFKFLKDNGLLRIDPLDEHGEIRRDLIVYGRDFLDPIGIQMFAKAIPSWFKARDKDQNVANLSILEKGLAKLRS